MDFAGIGKIGAFAKQKNLLFAANYRIKTGQSIVDGNGRLTLTKSTMFNSIQTSKKNSVSAADKTRLASIKAKLKSGKKLSEAEMNYLKEKDPKTYKKAKYADEAREELKNELRSAETKQEAREAVMRAVAKIAADCSADFDALKGGAGGGISFGGGDMNIGADMNLSGGRLKLYQLKIFQAANFQMPKILPTPKIRLRQIIFKLTMKNLTARLTFSTSIFMQFAQFKTNG